MSCHTPPNYKSAECVDIPNRVKGVRLFPLGKKFGRFRKGKKAYGKDTERASMRVKVLASKYAQHLQHIREHREALAKGVQAMVVSMSGAFQIAAIAAQPRPKDVSPEDHKRAKIIAICDAGIATAEALMNMAQSMGAVAVIMAPPEGVDLKAKTSIREIPIEVPKLETAELYLKPQRDRNQERLRSRHHSKRL